MGDAHATGGADSICRDCPDEREDHASENRHRRIPVRTERRGRARRELGDKVGKDDNFRGLTISGSVLYYTKGSGGNGVDTVYFLDTTGTARPDGVGLPIPGAPLPTTDGGRW